MVKNFRKELMISILSIAGSLLAFGIIAYFLSNAISAEADKISSDRNSAQTRSELIDSLAQQKASSPDVKKFQQAINLILPQKDDLVNYQAWLDGLSRIHQVSINFEFTGNTVPSNGTEAGYIGFSMNANGQYADLTNFLRDVEFKDPRFTTKFDSLDIVRNADTYGASINGKIFFR
ncbi:MAG TPA: hypothetical protein VMV71_00315 [Candidatus Paceibacterota bacterium]|nr:hypothetical protein [Candidatus Paceibacterota bacterium]